MNMITINGSRRKDGEVYPLATSERTALDALGCIAQYDFGFGAHVSSIETNDDTISIETTVTFMDCVDTSTYTGSSEDMHIILRLSELITIMSQGEHAEAVLKSVADSCAHLPLTPPILTMFAPLVVGDKKTRGSLLSVLTLEHYKENDSQMEAVIELSKNLSIADMIAAHELADGTNLEFIDALKLAM